MTDAREIDDAAALDARDPLARFRGEFYLPEVGIYLDGNSLGLMSRRAEAASLRALEDWKVRGIGGWLEGSPPWFTMAEEVGRRMAPLVGAAGDEVVVGGVDDVEPASVARDTVPAGTGGGGRSWRML